MLAGVGCDRHGPGIDPTQAPDPQIEPAESATDAQQTAVFAGGCFWCTEVVFEQLAGVSSVVSGYAGGTAQTANYRDVSSGGSDHAEAIQIIYDPEKITYGKLLKVFFTVAHDPTQKDRQGYDTGRQYRSAIFYDSEDKKSAAREYIRQLDESGAFKRPLATTLEALDHFYPAEEYHQDYVGHHPDNRYVVINALPKVEKLRTKFPDIVRGR